MVHQCHQCEERRSKSKLCSVPTFISGTCNYRILFGILFQRTETLINDHYRMPILIEIGITSISFKGRPHRKTSQHIGPDHEHLLAIFDHRLHSVSPDTVQGESGQCSIALLVLPLLVDTGVDMRHLRHHKVHWILMRFKGCCVKTIRHGQHGQAVFDEVFTSRRIQILVQKLILWPSWHLQIHCVVHIVFLQFSLGLDPRHWHELLVRHWLRNTTVLAPVGHIDQLLIEIRVPIVGAATPKVCPAIEAPPRDTT
mmetsp:Transcript_34641/g.74768  ORF Transcript_34641/g.74768 Transcript_34641/m.74768 type:complete len:255 (+) Transcript_34641:1040-1804(+)